MQQGIPGLVIPGTVYLCWKPDPTRSVNPLTGMDSTAAQDDGKISSGIGSLMTPLGGSSTPTRPRETTFGALEKEALSSRPSRVYVARRVDDQRILQQARLTGKFVGDHMPDQVSDQCSTSDIS